MSEDFLRGESPEVHSTGDHGITDSEGRAPRASAGSAAAGKASGDAAVAPASTAALSRRSLAAVVVMMCGAFVAILNQNLMTTAVPVFMTVFSVSSDVAQWLTTG